MEKPTSEALKKEKTPRPRYHMGQNVGFMLKLAWTSGEKKVIVLSLLSALTAVGLNLINLYVSPAILSAVERHVSIAELLGVIGGFVLGLMLVSAASAYVNANTKYGRIGVRSEIINLLNRKAATTSYPNVFDEGFTGLLAKSGDCVNTNSAATEAVWTTLTDLCTNFMGFLLYIGLLSPIQPMLIWVILLTACAGYFVSHRVNSWGYRHRAEEAEIEKQMFYLSRQSRNVTAAKDVRIFGFKPWLEDLSEKSLAAYTAFQGRAEAHYLWARITDLALAFLRNGVAYAYLIHLVLKGELGVAEFLLYFSAAGGFSAWITGLLDGFSILHRQSLDLSTVRECLDYREPFRFEGGLPLRPEANRQYELRLENVSFRYPGAERDTLCGLNLTLHPGEKLAIVGLNGAGKTTLVKLMCGFLDPTAGRVLLDGRDIRDYNRADYYAMFSAVFQNFTLLPGTIAVNVAQREADIDQARLMDCLEKAGLRPKIESLSRGWDTLLQREVYDEAIMLSGGETQRLMLARALYKNAPFVVLDEPTAALDPIAESEMYQKYNDMTRGKSSVYISHRLASTRFCDRILFIENGGICESGTHESLLKQNGRYAQLYHIQSKYYQEGADEHEEAK
jgi:ATP-binding cassette subfamily B protein